MSKQRRRILSIDGGGIYGLTSARWLRQLCEQDRTFLSGDDIWLFAGCSSGAVNSLLLASHDRPREAVLGGELERFWHDPGTFSNTDPVDQLLSWMELAGWFGEVDFLELLHRYLGDRTLGDLKHHVVISAFNWSGSLPVFKRYAKGAEPPSAHPFERLQKRMAHIADETSAIAADTEKQRRSWKPHIFNNAPGSPDRALPAVEVAYGAATPPGFRALRSGIGDGASFSANPTVDAVAFALGQARMEKGSEEQKDDRASEMLSSLSVLSLGDGTSRPYLFLPNSNFGFLTWGMIPVNPLTGAFYSPSSYSLQPSDQQAVMISRELLGESFFRLNPGIMDVPTVTAAYIARWPMWRNWLLDRITQATNGEESKARVAAALAFLRSDEWKDPSGEVRASS
jgi:patatin-like phospholipase/acyl hydrolase